MDMTKCALEDLQCSVLQPARVMDRSAMSRHLMCVKHWVSFFMFVRILNL